MPIFEACAAIALLLGIASIGIRLWETPPALTRRLELLEIDLQEAIDRMTTWMKRENVRRARDTKEQRETAPSDLTEDVARSSRKAQIRARLRIGS